MGRLWNYVLLLGSVLLTLAVAEMTLRWAPRIASVTVAAASLAVFDDIPRAVQAKVQARHGLISMAHAWKKIPAPVPPGARDAHWWHGALFVTDFNGMRRSEPFPPKQPGVTRVMVVGDSLTYGYGVAEEDTFVALLNKQIAGMEFLNLGIPGAQSEDILGVVRRFLPQLQPDVVVYAVCLNDFLPSQREEYEDAGAAYAFPIADEWKAFLLGHSRFAELVSDGYAAALRMLRLRYDFFDDILHDFAGYQRRFARDVAEMNAIVRAAGLPPMISLVVDQFALHGSRGYRIAQAAQKHLAAAGVDVIPTEDYYRRYNGQEMRVSHWEGHPNEIAHFIWSQMIAARLHDQRPAPRE
jgi:lysophospholipase L1-like esterase